mmetsp:Transcript_7859/g.17275  ORF Transcript_7859/g.17275 Transcript_7859/m.17275 type:complete len:283 (+) Transcript_7859:974-1822(+)
MEATTHNQSDSLLHSHPSDGATVWHCEGGLHRCWALEQHQVRVILFRHWPVIHAALARQHAAIGNKSNKPQFRKLPSCRSLILCGEDVRSQGILVQGIMKEATLHCIHEATHNLGCPMTLDGSSSSRQAQRQTGFNMILCGYHAAARKHVLTRRVDLYISTLAAAPTFTSHGLRPVRARATTQHVRQDASQKVTQGDVPDSRVGDILSREVCTASRHPHPHPRWRCIWISLHTVKEHLCSAAILHVPGSTHEVFVAWIAASLHLLERFLQSRPLRADRLPWC